jgi:hypothetical protein
MAALLASHGIFAQVPAKIAYQGYLTLSNGDPVADNSGPYTLKFTFDDGTTNPPTRVVSGVMTEKGLFSVVIGGGVAGPTPGTGNEGLPLNGWHPEAVQVSVESGSSTIIPPSIVQLTAVPYVLSM